MSISSMFTVSDENKIFLKRIFLIAVPIILAQLLNSAINVTDTLMIGSLGEDAITAVALGNQIFFLFVLILFGINGGASVLMGQYWGIQDKKSIHKTMGISLISSLLVAFVFMFFAVLIPEKLLIIFTRDENVLKAGATYLRIVALSYPFCAVSQTINMANRSTDKNKFPMITTIVALSVNFTLNYIFIFHVGLGVKGAAIGTFIARFCEMTTQIILMYRFKLPILGKFKDYFSANKEFIKIYFRRALPVIGNEVVWSVGVTLYVVAYGLVSVSESPQASVQIANTMKQLFTVFAAGIGSASAVIIGNMLGAGEIEMAKSYEKKLTKLVIVMSIITAIIIFVTAPTILLLFNVSDAVRTDTIIILRIVAITVPFQMLNFLYIIGILRPGGDTVRCLLIDAGGVWLVGVPLTFITAAVFNLPIYFVFLAASCEEYSKLFFALTRVRSKKWAKNIISEN